MALSLGIREFKSGFFDSERVKKSLKKAEHAVFSKMGAFIRTRARSSIKKAPMIDKATGKVTRKRKNVKLLAAISAPGQPPYSHEGSLRRLIEFGFDLQTGSVVIGPTPFRKGEAPGLLEFGGSTTLRYKSGKTKQANYRPRPFIGPAGDAEAPKFRELLRDMVK